MRIVFASFDYPPNRPGGSALSVKLLAEAMARRGHDVTVVTPRWNEDDVPVERPPVKLERWGEEAVFVQQGPELVVERYPRKRRRGIGWWRCYQALVQIGRGYADVFHAQDRRMFWPTWFAAKRLRKPMYLTLRDVGLLCPVAVCLLKSKTVPEDCSARKLWRECAPDYLAKYHQRTVGARLGWRWRRDWALRSRLVLVAKYLGLRVTRWMALGHVVGFVSDGLMTVYEKAGFLPSRARVPSIAWAPTAIKIRPEGRWVLFSGKQSYGKGFDDYQRAERLYVGPATMFMEADRHPQDWLAGLMSGAVAVVVPSRNCDALPRVALEAAYLGVPVIGSNVGGIPEITPCLVEPGDPVALAAMIRRLVEDDAYRKDVATECRRRAVTRFSEAACCEAVEAMYS